MAVSAATVEKLRAYVQGTAGDAYVAECAQEAADLVARHVGKVPAGTVPESMVARAEKEVGAELFHRRQSRNGIAGLDSTDFAPMRIARDPMKAAWPFLGPYLGPVVA